MKISNLRVLSFGDALAANNALQDALMALQVQILVQQSLLLFLLLDDDDGLSILLMLFQGAIFGLVESVSLF